MDYQEFLSKKLYMADGCGFDPVFMPDFLFDFQKHIVKWALQKGRSAVFADCGLGKTPMQLSWAANVSEKTHAPVLIVAPLAVSRQTQKEGDKFNIKVNIASDTSEILPGVNITNYEKLHKFCAKDISGIVLDESSILKNYSGKTRNFIIDFTKNTDYKLACTATPAPNDFMELGNHSEFLNAMSRVEMLAMYFTHDGGNTSKWRLKRHAEKKYWQFVLSWARVLRSPSDLGFDDSMFSLPELEIHTHVIECSKPINGRLFAMEAQTLNERREARKASLSERCEKARQLINEKQGSQFLVWCDFNNESETMAREYGYTQITGSDDDEYKAETMMGFSSGDVKVLVTKPSIAGFGMNWQNCSDVIFVGLSDSYEMFYQAVRRCWRFGQKNKVNVHVILSDAEMAVLENIKRKESEAHRMAEMILAESGQEKQHVHINYMAKNKMEVPAWLQ